MDDIDLEFAARPQQNLLNRQQILQKYSEAMRQIRTLAEHTYNIRPLYFDNYVLLHYFQQQQQRAERTGSSFAMSNLKSDVIKHIMDRRRRICFWLFYLALAYMCFMVYRHDKSNLRTLMHPAGMRLWRRVTLPLIRRYPRLTELYDESCLMENPFYELENLNCERCVNVQGVLDLTDVGASAEDTAKLVPFVFKLQQPSVSVDDLFNLYTSHHEVFRRDAYWLQSSSSSIGNLDDFFSLHNQTNKPTQSHAAETHNLWRCNRMLPARLLRRLFVRCAHSLLPSSGLALERFIAIDTAKAPAYMLPKTECAHAYVQQALGARMIILRPASECRHECRTLSVRLPQSFVLSYNWWYWKPISAPDPLAESYSLSLIGSYC